MWYSMYGILPTDKTKKKLAKQQNNLEFQNYFNLLLNMTQNIFEWKNLPETCDARMMENALIWRAYTAFYKDGDTIWSYSAGPGGKLTRYGYPSTGFLYALDGTTAQCQFYWPFMDNTKANGVLCLDNKQCYPIIHYIIRGAERIADAKRALDVAAQNSKYPYLINCSEEQMNSILSIFNDVYNNQPLIITQKNNDFANNVQLFNTNIKEGLIKELWDYYKNTYNDVLETLGIQANQNQDKKERMTITEVEGNTDFVDKSQDFRLQERKEFCERVNEAFGLNISVDYKKTALEKELEEKQNENQDIAGNFGNQDNSGNNGEPAGRSDNK